jgi:hypothetical protein
MAGGKHGQLLGVPGVQHECRLAVIFYYDVNADCERRTYIESAASQVKKTTRPKGSAMSKLEVGEDTTGHGNEGGNRRPGGCHNLDPHWF